MSDDDSRRDSDGYIYEKNRSGQYEKKWDFGTQDYARDNSRTERQQSGYSWDGKPLYRQFQDIPSSPKTSTNSDGCLQVGLVLVGIALLFSWIIIKATPILAPILMILTENFRKQDDQEKYKKWKTWSTLSGIAAIIVVLTGAGQLATSAFTFFQNTIIKQIHIIPFGSPAWMLPIYAMLFSAIVFILFFITGISPTAVVFLKIKENRLLSSGETSATKKIRYFMWTIIFIAISSIVLSVGSFFIFILFFS